MNWIVKHGWYFLLAAIAGEVLVPLAAAPFYRGYSHGTMALSALGSVSSPVRTVYNGWMLAAGMLFLLAVPAVFEAFHKTSFALSLACAVCIAVFAVGACIFTFLFSVNESKDVVTVASAIHGAGSVIGFMAMLPVPLFVSLLSFRSGERLTGMVAAVCFGLALVSFGLFVMADKPEFQHTWVAWEGLWQRLNLLFMYLPLGVLGVSKLVLTH